MTAFELLRSIISQASDLGQHEQELDAQFMPELVEIDTLLAELTDALEEEN